PDSFTSGVKAYNEASGGLRWKFRPLSVDVGYRYMQMEGKDGRRDNTLADGPYVGVGLSF
ncbi:YfaZ family outer membrane protein, partial [Serratia marcescens]